MADPQAIHIHIKGIVQGVGFRPFVYGLATRMGLKGWVRNTSSGVDIEVDGQTQELELFTYSLEREAPPLAKIDEMTVDEIPPNGCFSFEIVHSEAVEGEFIPISPDVGVCPDCLRELFDPDDRRYRYPFTNCTNCGPRFTIIQDIPYDRPKTTMAGFTMCPDCAAEYEDPLDRRFHAQPVACPVCGPQIWVEQCGEGPHAPSDLRTSGDRAIFMTHTLLFEGKIVAVKGLGGFHLACDALNATAVAELRRRKLRVDKPFALMMPDTETVRRHCYLDETEKQLLESPQRPIVVLRRRLESPVAREVAPGQDTIGVMLPYTPLHFLLFAPAPGGVDIPQPTVMVMTSGNLSEEPIATQNGEARERLAGLADAFLMHDRDIHTRCDDSVVRAVTAPGSPEKPTGERQGMYLRRSRGYAPGPVQLPFEPPSILATGGELKNAFCLTRDRYAFLSHHIGDMENFETLRSFEEGVEHFERLFRIQPAALAYDLHPDYMATRYALARSEREGIPACGVQHHHAHIAACMAENGLPGDQPLIGVSFDGAGYGEDGAIWGGEFFVADYRGYLRTHHLAYAPLPGGDVSVRKPARLALSYLWQAGLDWDPVLPCTAALDEEELRLLRAQLDQGINVPVTSSMGRLFDAIAALAGVRQQVNYEAQAAIELETLVDPDETGAYEFDTCWEDLGMVNPIPAIRSLVNDLHSGVTAPVIAARFHNGVARMVVDVCKCIRTRQGISQVALSGGVWQNVTLLHKTLPLLDEAGFAVWVHKQTPPNDGSLALGQAVIAGTKFG